MAVMKIGPECVGELSMIKLLYSKGGMKEGVGVWLRFVKLRNEAGVEIKEAREGGYGWGRLDTD